MCTESANHLWGETDKTGVTLTRGEKVSPRAHMRICCTGRQSGILVGFGNKPCKTYTSHNPCKSLWASLIALFVELSRAAGQRECAGEQHHRGWHTDLLLRLLFLLYPSLVTRRAVYAKVCKTGSPQAGAQHVPLRARGPPQQVTTHPQPCSSPPYYFKVLAGNPYKEELSS